MSNFSNSDLSVFPITAAPPPLFPLGLGVEKYFKPSSSNIFSISDLGKPSKKKYYLDREIVPIPSDTPTIETVSEYLDSEYW